MGRLEKMRAIMRMVGFQAAIDPDHWAEGTARRTLFMKSIDVPFSLQQPNGLLHGEEGDYLLRDPETGYTTILPAAVATSLFQPTSFNPVEVEKDSHGTDRTIRIDDPGPTGADTRESHDNDHAQAQQG